MSSILGYQREEKESVIREFFTLGGRPLCVHCGEEFDIRLSYGARKEVTLAVSCRGCANGFTWSPPRNPSTWEPLHLDYFEERRRAGAELRCPFDDCGVSCAEYSDGRVTFRCPYCGRTGSRSAESIRLDR